LKAEVHYLKKDRSRTGKFKNDNKPGPTLVQGKKN